MGVPSVPRLGRDMGEPGARRRIRDANEMLTGRALNLSAGEMDFALQRLVAVGAVKFEFRCCHRFYLHKRKSRGKSISKLLHILFASKLRLIW
jgi:hypothetical protein